MKGISEAKTTSNTHCLLRESGSQNMTEELQITQAGPGTSLVHLHFSYLLIAKASEFPDDAWLVRMAELPSSRIYVVLPVPQAIKFIK